MTPTARAIVSALAQHPDPVEVSELPGSPSSRARALDRLCLAGTVSLIWTPDGARLAVLTATARDSYPLEKAA